MVTTTQSHPVVGTIADGHFVVDFTDYEMWEFHLTGGFVGDRLAGTLIVLLDHPQGFGLAVGEASYVATREVPGEGSAR